MAKRVPFVVVDRFRRQPTSVGLGPGSFAVEDLSDKMAESDRRHFDFVGTLKNGKLERFVDMQRWGSGYVLAVRFAGRDDPEFLKRTIGTRFPQPPELKQKK